MVKRLVLMAAAIGGAILAMVLAPDVASAADRRVALVVGNSTYQTVPQLPNPSRDASAVAQMFKDAGFDDVQVELNLGNLEFKRAIRKFQDLADQADIAVIYYAGHGLEVGSTNYLIPVDAKLASDRDADDEAIPLERLVASADGARHLRLIILDACRDDPFVKIMRRERKVATRTTVTSGLGKVEPTSTDTLIAYASKAGSTAEDGEGQHSPFTTSLLKNLTVPGLDVRLAFGRIKDEVMKSTGGRQEPFVYGSLGGSNISLVPPPPVPQEASPDDIRVDYKLVEKVGTARAWQAFLSSHPTGMYADLARAQLDKLGPPPEAPQPNTVIASLPPAPSPFNGDNPTKESIEWDRLKDSTDQGALLKFIRKFPDSQQAIYAKQRLDVLTQAAKEREDKARADREAAAKAAEAARLEAEQKKAEQAAAKKREDDERRAKAAEAEQQAKAAAAEQAAAKKREDDERRAKAAEAEQQAKAVAAEQAAAKKREDDERRAKAAEAEQKAKALAAEQAAAKKREDDERRAKEAEAEQKAKAVAAEQAAAKKREEEERRAKAAEAEQQAKAVEAERKAAEAKQKAEEAEKTKEAAEAAALRAASEKQAREAEEARRKAELASALEATCKKEQGKLDELAAKGSDGSAIADLTSFSKTVTCERVRPAVVATLEKFKGEVAKRAAEAICKNEQDKLDALTAKGSDGTAVADLTSFSKTVSCDRVRPAVVATLEKFKGEVARRAAEATCRNEQDKLDALTAKGSDGSAVADLTSLSKTVSCDRVRPAVVATLDKFKAEVAKRASEAAALRAANEKQAREAEEARKKAELAVAQEAACKKEQGRLDELASKGSDGTGVADLTSFSKTVTCDRIRPVVVATLGNFKIEAAKRDATLPNSFELVRAAQGQLARLGCFSGRMDGNLIATRTALGRYLSVKGQPPANTDITESLVADLGKQTDRVCPVECQPDEVVKGDSCVPVEKPVATAPTTTPAPANKPPRAASRHNEDEDRPARKPQQQQQQPKRQAETQRSRPAAERAPPRQQAAARPSGGGGGGGGGHTAVVGVGF